METDRKTEPAMNIVKTAEATPNLTVFHRMVKAAGLDQTLEGEGPFTVFAPTDEAFSKLPQGVLENLLKPWNRAELVEVLKGHMAAGTTMAPVVKIIELPTVGGPTLRVKVDSHGVTINESRVTRADIACSNGVIHAIDNVVLPDGK
jgi:uncharacterized surface protein with fasciclin (FAS1) repeats